jgi:hypothetical protein
LHIKALGALRPFGDRAWALGSRCGFSEFFLLQGRREKSEEHKPMVLPTNWNNSESEGVRREERDERPAEERNEAGRRRPDYSIRIHSSQFCLSIIKTNAVSGWPCFCPAVLLITLNNVVKSKLSLPES